MSFNEVPIAENNRDEVLKIIHSDLFKKIFLNNVITNVIIFGSLASGIFNEESDIDIAVISEDKISFNTELNITLELEELLGRNIDFIDINDENINNIIKIEALNSEEVIIKDNLLDEALKSYDRLYRENEEFWYILDKVVLDNE
ncbi:nucleotidyltransferase domain-containing protein [Clostridium sp. MB40-C1]|uniref:nucleotidyltransferase family protein n=1 Tax=Clostridium sp. MB40-C1 TaxID=3070996 RepID=UPI0027E0F7E9|nr:nucleotidyltransferase domain-containing protein [Clostridium sp. MB40-C1]WMJ79339.1 nucleotidyltransferase domain-containing protein [Clostridium sp. MB40-C1]